MIFNHCIYGTINKDIGTLTCTYYNYNLEEIISKTVILSANTYQFNLGDQDLKGINSSIKEGDIVILEYFDEDDNKMYSNNCILDLSDNIQEFNIDTDSFQGETSTEANFSIAENLVKTSNYKLTEVSNDLYNYFKVQDIEDSTNPIIKYEGNSNILKFVPLDSHKYSILQKVVNKTTNIITEKTYEFNAIVSAATISRSNKCKGINDSIKILFMGTDPSKDANMTVYKNNDIVETGNMGIENNNLYSYNFVFPNKGYYCFKIDYLDETFLTTFRVLQNNFKIYYHDENHTSNLSLSFDYYSVDDMDVLLGSGNLIDIGDGTYTSESLEISYGDYLFIVDEEEYITSFEECSPIQTEGSDTKLITTEEIYWVFPNNLGD